MDVVFTDLSAVASADLDPAAFVVLDRAEFDKRELGTAHGLDSMALALVDRRSENFDTVVFFAPDHDASFGEIRDTCVLDYQLCLIRHDSNCRVVQRAS